MTSANTKWILKAPDTRHARWVRALRHWGVHAAAAVVRLKAIAPYALIELVLPGGSMVALLLWFYRRGNNGAGFGPIPMQLLAFLRLAMAHLNELIRHATATGPVDSMVNPIAATSNRRPYALLQRSSGRQFVFEDDLSNCVPAVRLCPIADRSIAVNGESHEHGNKHFCASRANDSGR